MPDRVERIAAAGALTLLILHFMHQISGESFTLGTLAVFGLGLFSGLMLAMNRHA